MGNDSDISSFKNGPYCRLCCNGKGWYNKCDDCSMCLKVRLEERERKRERELRERFLRIEEEERFNRRRRVIERSRRYENKSILNNVIGNLNSIDKYL